MKPCPGSGSAGVKETNNLENGRQIVYFSCPTCGVMLPNTPIKEHYRLENKG